MGALAVGEQQWVKCCLEDMIEFVSWVPRCKPAILDPKLEDSITREREW